MKRFPNLEDKLINEALTAAVSQFTGKDAVYSFIKQVLTEKERQVLGRRIAIARLILAGATYYEVREKLHISPNTFRNIRQWISNELPAYSNIITEKKNSTREKGQQRTRKVREQTIPFSFEDLKRRYPMHFLLFNLTDELLTSKKNNPNSKTTK